MRKLIIMLLTISLVLTGCVSQKPPVDEKIPPVEQQPGEQKNKDEVSKEVSANFDKLLLENKKPNEIIKFIDNNIEKIEKLQASDMVERLTKVQHDSLEGYMDKMYEGNNFELMADYFLSSKDEEGRINDVKSESLKVLLYEILDGGYKIHMVEGGPVLGIDYEKLKRYNSYITEEIKEFISLEAEESKNPFAMDGGLMIPVEELADRIAKSERYLKNYPDSPRSEEIGMRNKGTIGLYLTGLPNTPAFDYESKKISEEFLTSYKRTIKDYKGTVFAEIVEEYLIVLEKDNFKKSDAVTAFVEKNELLKGYIIYFIGIK